MHLELIVVLDALPYTNLYFYLGLCVSVVR